MTREPIYYVKQGRRYVPVAYGQEPFVPADGVWLVTPSPYGGLRSASCIMRIGDAPDVMVAAAFAKHRDLIASTVLKHWKDRTATSANDIANAIVLAVAAAESKGGKP